MSLRDVDGFSKTKQRTTYLLFEGVEREKLSLKELCFYFTRDNLFHVPSIKNGHTPLS